MMRPTKLPSDNNNDNNNDSNKDSNIGKVAEKWKTVKNWLHWDMSK